MFVMTFILAVLALPMTFSGAGRDTVRVQPKVDSMQVCAPSDSVFSYARPDTVRVQAKVDSVQIRAHVDSLQVLAARDTVQVSAEADSTSRARIPVVGISTNIPYDITWVPGYGVTSIPSFSLEFYPGKWKHWDTHRFMQINNITLWTRRYFRTRARSEESVKGFYLLANINAARFGIGFDADRGWQGEGLGASLGAGHKWTWGRFFVDAGLAVGYFYARYDPYVWGNDGTGWYYYDYTGDAAYLGSDNDSDGTFSRTHWSFGAAGSRKAPTYWGWGMSSKHLLMSLNQKFSKPRCVRDL